MEIHSITGFIASYILDQQGQLSLDAVKKHVIEVAFWQFFIGLLV